MLEELGCGELFQWNNEESLYHALIAVYENYNAYLNDSKGNHDFVCNKFDRMKMFYEFWSDVCGVKSQ